MADKIGIMHGHNRKACKFTRPPNSKLPLVSPPPIVTHGFDTTVLVAATVKHIGDTVRVSVDSDTLLMYRIIYLNRPEQGPIDCLTLLACCKTLVLNQKGLNVPVGYIPGASDLFQGARPKAFERTALALCAVLITLMDTVPKEISATEIHGIIDAHLVPNKSKCHTQMKTISAACKPVALMLKEVFDRMHGMLLNVCDSRMLHVRPDSIKIVIPYDPLRCPSPPGVPFVGDEELVLDMHTLRCIDVSFLEAANKAGTANGPKIYAGTYLTAMFSLGVAGDLPPFLLNPTVIRIMFGVLRAVPDKWVGAVVPEVLVFTLMMHLLFHFAFVEELMDMDQSKWSETQVRKLNTLRLLCTSIPESIDKWTKIFGLVTDPNVVTALPHHEAVDDPLYKYAVRRAISFAVFGVQTVRMATPSGSGRQWWEVAAGLRVPNTSVDLSPFLWTGLYNGLPMGKFIVPEPRVRASAIIAFASKTPEWAPVAGRLEDLPAAMYDPKRPQLEAMLYYVCKATTSFQETGSDLIKQLFKVNLNDPMYEDPVKREEDLRSACATVTECAELLNVKRF